VGPLVSQAMGAFCVTSNWVFGVTRSGAFSITLNKGFGVKMFGICSGPHEWSLLSQCVGGLFY